MSFRARHSLSVLLPLALSACVSGKLDPLDTSSDSAVDTDIDGTPDTDVLDTSNDTGPAVDTDIAPDTDVAPDTDGADTSPPVDTSLVDTGVGPWWDSSDTSVDTSVDTGPDTWNWDTGTDTGPGDTDPPAPVPPEGLTIFLTDAGTSGDFGGIAAADALCNASPARPNNGTYKALLVDGTNRVACSSYDCGTSGAAENVDWALLGNTAYFRGVDDAYIGRTNDAGLLGFPFTTPIWDTNPEVWTGLSYGWQSSSDCNNWTDVNSFGNVGLANEVNSDFFYKYLQFCNRTNVLMYCAQQLPPGKVIFATDSQPSGNLGGVAGADAECQAAAPIPGTFKAMIVDGVNRVACTSSSCGTGAGEHIDWPVEPSTAYYNLSGDVIGTTDANALFTFPLDNAVSPRGVEVWTGLNGDWTTGDTCAGWTDGVSAFGVNGIASRLDDSSIAAYDQNCDRTNITLYCVQQ